MDDRRRRALIGWIGGSLAFPLAWFLFSHFVEREPVGPAAQSAAIVGAFWSAAMFVLMVVLPNRRKSD